MQFVVGDADLGTQSVFVAVGKAGRSVDQHRRRIDLAQEAQRGVVVLGNDGIGVVAAEVIDVLDRLGHAGQRRDRENRRQVFGAPVVFTRRATRDAGRAQQVDGLGTAAQLDALGGIDFPERRQHARRDRLRDQQRFHRVAGAVALRLGVVGDRDRAGEVGVAIEVDVADAVEVLDHRHLRFAHQPLDQTFAAARHDDVDILRHRDQQTDRGAIGGCDQLDGVGR